MRALSRQQRRVLERLWAGDTVKTAAAHLGISPKTATTYLTRLRRVNGVPTTIALIRTAVRTGALQP